jgi:hypothetical protein
VIPGNARKMARCTLRSLLRGAPVTLLCFSSGAALVAQSMAITKPAANDILSGFTGYQFHASLNSAPAAVKVCYTVDAYPAQNPGIDSY